MSDANIQNKHPNFYGKDGRFYLVKCFKCGLENYAMSVYDGKCAWCGDKVESKVKVEEGA